MRLCAGGTILLACLACSGWTSGVSMREEALREAEEARARARADWEAQKAAEAREIVTPTAGENVAPTAGENVAPMVEPAGSASPPAAPALPAPVEADDEEGSGKDKVPFEIVDATIRGSVAIRACFAEWERQNPAVSRVDVELTLNGRGQARDVVVRGVHAADSLGKCLEAALAVTRFPPGKKQRFTYPIQRY